VHYKNPETCKKEEDSPGNQGAMPGRGFLTTLHKYLTQK
jgi:hypothetical protein